MVGLAGTVANKYLILEGQIHWFKGRTESNDVLLRNRVPTKTSG